MIILSFPCGSFRVDRGWRHGISPGGSDEARTEEVMGRTVQIIDVE